MNLNRLSGHWGMGFAVLIVSTTAHAQGTPAPPAPSSGASVYFYNGCRNDIFNLGSQGWLLGQMGLLGASGLVNFPSAPAAPAPGFGAGVTHRPIGAGDGLANSPGSSLSNGAGQPIGYVNANSTQFAFDLDKVAMNDILALLPNANQIVISKHGLTGGTTLDNGTAYGGYDGEPYPGWGPTPDPGTPPTPTPEPPPEPGPDDPYPLPTGHAYDVYLNTCFSEDVPSGGQSPCGSVRGIGGGVTARGNNGVIYKGPTIRNMDDAQLQKVMSDAVAAGNFVDVQGRNGTTRRLADLPGFYGSMSLEDFSNYVRGLGQLSSNHISVSWYKGSSPTMKSTPMSESTYLELLEKPLHYYLPPQRVTGDGGRLEYGPVRYEPTIVLEVPAGALRDEAQPLLIGMRPHAELLPDGFRPATPFVNVDFYELHRSLRFREPATLTLDLGFASPSALWVVRIDEHSGAVNLLEYSLGEDGKSLSIEIEGEGTFVAVTLDDGSVVDNTIELLKQSGWL